jgi:hypothetical protein
MRLGAAVGKRLGELGDRLGVDRIVLVEPPGGFGEVPDPFRIDDPDFNAGRAQRFRPASLIAAARLHHRPADPVCAQPCDQIGLSFRGARRRQVQSLRTNAGVDFALCDIEADNARLMWHTRTPFLARAGSRAHATVRVEEDARPVPRFPAVSPVVATGSDPATGGCSNNRPFADPATFSGHKVARRAGWGGARCLDVSRIAQPSLRTCVDPDLLSTPHPALRATAARRRVAHAGMSAAAISRPGATSPNIVTRPGIRSWKATTREVGLAPCRLRSSSEEFSPVPDRKAQRSLWTARPRTWFARAARTEGDRRPAVKTGRRYFTAAPT